MAGVTGRPWRVLVVDDEENLNWSLVTSLRREQYQTDGALSAEAALQQLSARPYDCVISDVKMPGMDGFELLQWLRRNQPRTRVIMMTAFGSPTARQEALQGGVVAYLEKPFDLRVLKEELRQLSTSAHGGTPAEAEGYDALDIAQVINLTHRDLAIRIESAGAHGVLRFLRGDLISAEAGPLRGEAAFFALCVPRGVRVEQEPWDGRGERNIAQPLSRLIFQALGLRERHSPLPRTSASQPPAGQFPTPPPSPASEGSPVERPPLETPTHHLPTTAAPANGMESGAAAGQGTESPPADLSTAEAPAFGTGALGLIQPSDTLAALTQRMAEGFPVPCSVALLRSDGMLLAQSRVGISAFPPGAFAHLAAATQAALRALLVADWGAFEEYRVQASQAILVVRRQTRDILCAVALPREADPALVAMILGQHEAELADALR